MSLSSLIEENRVAPVIIREATIEDAPAMARVHVDTWRTTYPGIVPDDVLAGLSYARSEKIWADILATGGEPQFNYVAEADGGEVVGIASGGPERADTAGYDGELYGVYVLKVAQGKGLGRKLTETVGRQLRERGFESMLVWVLKDNHPARGFYERLGGVYVTEKEIVIRRATLLEVAYGWPDVEYLWDIRGR